jgi:hypothetical protein
MYASHYLCSASLICLACRACHARRSGSAGYVIAASLRSPGQFCLSNEQKLISNAQNLSTQSSQHRIKKHLRDLDEYVLKAS